MERVKWIFWRLGQAFLILDGFYTSLKNQPTKQFFFEEMLGLESQLMRDIPSYSYSCSIVHCETFTITEIFTIFHFLVCSDCGLRAFSLVNDLTSGSYHYCFVRSCVAEHRQKNSVLQLI